MTATMGGGINAADIYHPVPPPPGDCIKLPSNADLTTTDYDMRKYHPAVKDCISYLRDQLVRNNEVYFTSDLVSYLRSRQLHDAPLNDPAYIQASRAFIAAWRFMKEYVVR